MMDHAAALARVTQDGTELEHLPMDFRDDAAIVRAAVRQCGAALRWASWRLSNDFSILMAAVQQDGMAIRHAPDCATVSMERALSHAAVCQNGLALEFVLSEAENERIVMAAVRQNGLAIRWAWSLEALRNRRAISHAAVLQNGLALQWLPHELRASTSIVHAAVRQNGMALQWALRATEGVFVTAVSQNGLALMWVGFPARTRAAVRHRIWRHAVFQNRRAIQYIPAYEQGPFRRLGRAGARIFLRHMPRHLPPEIVEVIVAFVPS